MANLKTQKALNGKLPMLRTCAQLDLNTQVPILSLRTRPAILDENRKDGIKLHAQVGQPQEGGICSLTMKAKHVPGVPEEL